MTRPADNSDALLIPPAPRMCVCGHPVYDEEPRCPLCACQEHKPRLPAVGGHSAPAAVSPGGAWTGPQLELRGAVLALPSGGPSAVRLARLLVRLARLCYAVEDDGALGLPTNLSDADLALWIGARRRSVETALMEWRSRGVVDRWQEAALQEPGPN